jgi:hypothetical protein
LLPLFNLPIRVRPKPVSHQLKPCSSNSKLGRPNKTPEHRSGPYSPFKMPKQRWRKMPRHGSGPCKRTDKSGPCKIPEQRSGGSKMHGHRSRPYKMHEHRTSLCKMPRRRRSCQASVGAIRPSRNRGRSPGFL